MRRTCFSKPSARARWLAPLRCPRAPRRSESAGFRVGARHALDWGLDQRSPCADPSIGPSTLRGSYVGASGNFAAGPGLGVNVLIDGSRQTIVPQPPSVERAIRFNLAAE
jgi:hypothetical protein